jgi:hypothetical protein
MKGSVRELKGDGGARRKASSNTERHARTSSTDKRPQSSSAWETRGGERAGEREGRGTLLPSLPPLSSLSLSPLFSRSTHRATQAGLDPDATSGRGGIAGAGRARATACRHLVCACAPGRSEQRSKHPLLPLLWEEGGEQGLV